MGVSKSFGMFPKSLKEKWLILGGSVFSNQRSRLSGQFVFRAINARQDQPVG